jgi:hypothetical protein
MSDQARTALRDILDLIEAGDRATVNPENAFRHFSDLNRKMVEVRMIAKRGLAGGGR